jgi:NAD+ diphosphatase
MYKSGRSCVFDFIVSIKEYSREHTRMKPHVYTKSVLEPLQAGWWFIFSGYRILVHEKEGRFSFPFVENTSRLTLDVTRVRCLGHLDGSPCYEAECDAGARAPEGMSFEGLRPLFGHVDDRFFRLAGRALQIIDWDRTHQFCSRCGRPTEEKDDETAKICTSCGCMSFPVASAAIIVAVTRDERILLARASRFPENMYSVLAGFVEPGESLEECVRREIREEVGIEVTNIRYFGSQSWPFPNSLMIGFTADHEAGEIKVDGKEIVDAGWFPADHLPQIPGKISIARRLIDWFVARKHQDS